ncbi:piggyBac transposable element-derived protein 4-like [Nilaparvata lugens]|uniref:piggyBac transposable element-derived protein 4-like n=1 Tax=Nilaparvata lugens TaxID=108931 RepID=UPI00193EB860|nr:piggyBac transposable element-derived protein 4-like [Nilaparvata lugens]
MIHFNDNEIRPDGDESAKRLHKISTVIELVNSRFIEAVTPGKTLCIDETMVPFRGRVVFKQYIKGKRHKYGIKLYKLCSQEGYTCKLKIYSGKETILDSKPITTSLVLKLMNPFLDEGRHLFTGNFYTSVDLAHELIDRKTYLTGTLRKNRKHVPKAVVNRKLKKGELVSLQSNSDVIVAKWKDKRDVLFLTSRAVPEMVTIATKRGQEIQKPSSIVEYNAGKTFIDLDELLQHST